MGSEMCIRDRNTSALVEEKYKFTSKNIVFKKKIQEISSKDKSIVIDQNGNNYSTDNFLYLIDSSLLKAKNVNIINNIDKTKKDKYFFSEGFFNLDNNNFVSKETKINVHKNKIK